MGNDAPGDSRSYADKVKALVETLNSYNGSDQKGQMSHVISEIVRACNEDGSLASAGLCVLHDESYGKLKFSATVKDFEDTSVRCIGDSQVLHVCSMLHVPLIVGSIIASYSERVENNTEGNTEAKVPGDERPIAGTCKNTYTVVDVCKLLIERGADVNSIASERPVPVKDGRHMVSAAVSVYERKTPLFYAIERDFKHAARTLIARGADYNFGMISKYSYSAKTLPVMYAMERVLDCYKEHRLPERLPLQIANILIERVGVDALIGKMGSDRNVRDTTLLFVSLVGMSSDMLTMMIREVDNAQISIVELFLKCTRVYRKELSNARKSPKYREVVGNVENSGKASPNKFSSLVDLRTTAKSGSRTESLIDLRVPSDVKKDIENRRAIFSANVGDEQMQILSLAAYLGSVSIVKWLLKNEVLNVNVYINKSDYKGRSAIHWAALANNAEIVRMLLDEGATTEATKRPYLTVAHMAASAGSVDVLRVLNSRCPEVLLQIDGEGFNILHHAARCLNNSLKTVQYIVDCVKGIDTEQGIDCDAGYKLSVPRIDNAYRLSTSKIDDAYKLIVSRIDSSYELLLSNIGDKCKLDITGVEDQYRTYVSRIDNAYTAYLKALSREYARPEDVSSSIGPKQNEVDELQGCNDFTPEDLFEIMKRKAGELAEEKKREAKIEAEEAKRKACELAEEKKRDELGVRDCFTEHGGNAAHIAIVAGQYGAAKFLIEGAYCDVAAKTSEGFTPLDILTEKNETILHMAVVRRDSKFLRMLLGFKGIDVNARCSKRMGYTALHIAVLDGNLEIVEILLSVKGIDLNAKSKKEGRTALHMAVAKRATNIVRALLTAKEIDVNAISAKEGRTALHMAVAKKNLEIVKVLLSAKSTDVNARSVKEGYTALDYAIRNAKRSKDRFGCNNDSDIMNALLADPRQDLVKDMGFFCKVPYAEMLQREDLLDSKGVDLLIQRSNKSNINISGIGAISTSFAMCTAGLIAAAAFADKIISRVMGRSISISLETKMLMGITVMAFIIAMYVGICIKYVIEASKTRSRYISEFYVNNSDIRRRRRYATAGSSNSSSRSASGADTGSTFSDGTSSDGGVNASLLIPDSSIGQVRTQSYDNLHDMAYDADGSECERSSYGDRVGRRSRYRAKDSDSVQGWIASQAQGSSSMCM